MEQEGKSGENVLGNGGKGKGEEVGVVGYHWVGVGRLPTQCGR